MDPIRGVLASEQVEPLITPSLADAEQIVRSFIGMMATGGISELDVAVGPVSIRLRSRMLNGSGASGLVDQGDVEADIVPQPPAAHHMITAPMIGTFYTAATPGGPLFVHVGDHVDAGQPIGIIEAMKIMNEIVADQSGVIIELLAENSQPVEYGSPLMRLDLTGSATA